MRRRLALCVGALGVTIAVAGSARGWEPIAANRPTWPDGAPYALQEDGSVDLGGFAASRAFVDQAFADWAAVSCTSLSLDPRGPTDAAPGTFDGLSVVGWVEAGWPHSRTAIGITSARWGARIIEADIELNAVDFEWSTGDVSLPVVDTYSLVLHEAGHALGLDHTDVLGSAMWPTYVGGVVPLAADDELGICALYPDDGIGCDLTGCPAGQRCEVDGSCVPEVGDGGVCAPCATSDDCGGPGDACLTYPSGATFCGRACVDDDDCPGEEGRCAGSELGPQCVRFVDGEASCEGVVPACRRDSDCPGEGLCDLGSCVPPGAGAGLGAGCAADDDCASGRCLAGACTRTCDWAEPASCPSGFYCDEEAFSSCAAGACVAGEAGERPLGASCGRDTQCAGLACVDGRCAEPCVPGGVQACPVGTVCQVGALSCQGACADALVLGDVCAMDRDCASRLCVVDGDDAYCSRFCTDADPCPSDFACETMGDASLCVPLLASLGETCERGGDCLSGLCIRDDPDRYCTRNCNDELAPCPEGFRCVATSDGSEQVCQPRPGCGCQAPGASGEPLSAAWLLAAMLLAGLGRRRRRGAP